MKTYVLSLNECSHGTKMLALRRGTVGTRLTRMKCCGQWTETNTWPLRITDLERIVAVVNDAIEDL